MRWRESRRARRSRPTRLYEWRMGVAVTFCAQPEHERSENENDHSFFRGSEKESLPGLIEFGTPAFFQLAKPFGVNSQLGPFAAAEPEQSDNAS